MAIETVVAGRYAGTYNAIDVGFTEDGYELEQRSSAENVDKSDIYGDSLLDFVYRGGEVRMRFNCKVYKAGSKTPFWPWGAFGVMATTLAPISRLASAVASAMVLTATSATPAATMPATLTGSKAILPPGSNLRLLYSSRVRNVPNELVLLPSESGGTVTWWSET